MKITRPTTITNEVNESFSGPDEVVFDNFPAHRMDNISSGGEDVENSTARSILRVDWDLRFIPDLDIKTNWKLVDRFDGKTYKVVAPVTDIGRREGLLVKTEIVE